MHAVRVSNSELWEPYLRREETALQTNFASNIYMNLNNSIILVSNVSYFRHACIHILGPMPMKTDTYMRACRYDKLRTMYVCAAIVCACVSVLFAASIQMNLMNFSERKSIPETNTENL